MKDAAAKLWRLSVRSFNARPMATAMMVLALGFAVAACALWRNASVGAHQHSRARYAGYMI